MKKKNLLSALKLVRPALGNPNLIPGLDSFHIKNNLISAFNGSLFLSTIVEEDPQLPIVGSIVGDTFYKLINELGEDITMEATDFPPPMENLLHIKSGKSKTSFPISQIDLSFLEKIPENTVATSLPTSVLFAAGLKRCLSSMGGKGTLTAEAGVSVFIENGKCRMYSNNGIYFSRFVFPLEENTDKIEVFLPAAFCEQLLFLYSELGREPLTISVGEKYVIADFSTTLLRSSFYANPVDTETCGLFDHHVEKISTVPLPKEISEAIKRSEIISGDGSVELDFGLEDKLVVTANGKGSQQLVEEIDLPYPEQGSIKIDVRNFKKALDTSKSIGISDSFIVLIGAEDYYNQLIMGKD
jgi:DNA polymerase III sliding clamp (beta) subunit (PCNA family)